MEELVIMARGLKLASGGSGTRMKFAPEADVYRQVGAWFACVVLC